MWLWAHLGLQHLEVGPWASWKFSGRSEPASSELGSSRNAEKLLPPITDLNLNRGLQAPGYQGSNFPSTKTHMHDFKVKACDISQLDTSSWLLQSATGVWEQKKRQGLTLLWTKDTFFEGCCTEASLYPGELDFVSRHQPQISSPLIHFLEGFAFTMHSQHI